MNTRYTYILVDALCLFFPLVFSFHPKIRFYKSLTSFLISSLLTASFFIAWDMLFTNLNVWYFKAVYVTGVYVYNLPLEEILFFFCIPYACVFTYYCIRLFLSLDRLTKAANAISIVLCVFLLILAFLNYGRLYTFSTFFFLAVFIVFCLIKHVRFMASFYLAFLIILLPFFISNGILTQSVVMYNREHNLGIRLFTIPVEDVFYGMLLMLMNVYGFEYFSTKSRARP